MHGIIASLKLAGVPTAVGASQSQIASLTLEDVLDSKSNCVSKHLGEIADSIHEWEGAVAENLELTAADVSNIITKYPRKLNLQMLVIMANKLNLLVLLFLQNYS